MPSEIKTENLGLNKWEGNEYPKRTDFVNDNEIIDEAIGKLESLKTENKSNIVAAVNEVREQNDNLASQIGTIETQTLPESYESSRNISSLSKRGKLDAGLNGMTLVNSVVNGDFSDGTTGWIGIGTNPVIVDNNLICDVSSTFMVEQSLNNLNSGDTVFIANKYISNEADASIACTLRNSSNVTIASSIFNYNQNTLTTEGKKVVLPSDVSNIRIVRNTAGTTGNIEIYHMFLINMTALGIEDFTEEQMLNFVRNGYIDGLQGASNIEVLSCGKNLFDLQKTYYSLDISTTYYLTETGLVVSNTALGWRDVQFLYKLKPNTSYHLSCNIVGDIPKVYITDENGIQALGSFIASGGVTFTTPDNGKVLIYFYSNASDDNIASQAEYSNILLEEDNGQELGVYEEYKPTSNLYKTLDGEVITLHRVPNGVADRIVEQNGQMRLEKNVEEYVLQSGDITALNTAGALDYLIIALPLTWSDGHYSVIMDGATYNNSASSADIQYAYTFVSRITDKKINYYVPKDTYADLAAAQTALAGTKIIYQLAEPQIIDTNVIPLIAEPNGHVFISSDGCLPSNIMSYPINLGAQMDGVIEGQKQLNEYLKDRVIEESGSNENGNYVRFADGTQICLKSEYFEIPIDTATGNLFYNNVNWIFPAAFISAPNYVGNTPMQSGKQIWGGSLAVVPTQTAAILRVFSALSLTTAITEMRFVAIGRWK